jgi:hypothetical protein
MIYEINIYDNGLLNKKNTIVRTAVKTNRAENPYPRGYRSTPINPR